MDFAWSDQQRELLDAVDRFASQQLNYNMIENDRDGVFNHDAWKKCGAFGIQGLTLSANSAAIWSQPLFQGVSLIIAVALASRPAVRKLRARTAAASPEEART